MANADYFRKQAETCFRLSQTVHGEVAHRLLAMAEEYRAKADRAEAESRDMPQGRVVPEVKEDEPGG
jgi:hypothetical protein